MDQYSQIIEALHLRNWYALAALTLTLLVQLFKNAPKLKTLWQRIPDGYRWALPVLSGAVTGFTQAFAASLPFGAALLAAVGGAVGISIPSMGINALLTESPVKWNGGAGGQPVPDKPKVGVGPSLGVGLVFLFACGLAGFQTSCSIFGAKGSLWPAIGACAEPISETLFSETESVLTSSGGNYEDDLLALGKTEGLQFVECAVKSVVEALSARIAARKPGERITPDEGIGVARGKAFLAKIEETHK